MRTLIAAIRQNWVGIARLPQALHRAGFQVRALCLKNSYLAGSSYLEGTYLFETVLTTAAYAEGLRNVLETWEPELLVPGDDAAAQFLHEWWQASDPARERDARVRTVIERSLGEPARYAEAERKSLLGRIAEAAGVPVPARVASPSAEEARAFVGQHGLPVVVKADFGAAGEGVRVCTTEAELLAFLSELPKENSDLLGRPTTVSLQRFIAGAPAAVAFSALRGKILAAFAYCKENTYPGPNGQTSLARIITRADMVAVAARVVEYLGYTGFGGVDFMIENESGKAYMIEFNGRATSTCHLGNLLGVDLCRALYAALTGTAAPVAAGGAGPEFVALFPYEWCRDKNSPHLYSAYHDVPWDDPPLLAHLMNPAAGREPRPNEAVRS